MVAGESYYPTNDQHLREYAAKAASYILRPNHQSGGGSAQTSVLAMALYDAIGALHGHEGNYPKKLVLNYHGAQPTNEHGEPVPLAPEDAVPGNIIIVISLNAHKVELLHVDYRLPVVGKFF